MSDYQRNILMDRPASGSGWPKDIWEKDHPWRGSSIAQIFTEIALHCIAMYIMGSTVKFAAGHGYYNIGTAVYKELPASARMMYAGAMHYVVTGAITVLVEIAWVFYMWAYWGEDVGENYEHAVCFFLFWNLCSTWTGSWIFRVGFVRLAREQ